MIEDSPVRIYALGGLGEVGKNTYVYETDNSIILVDAGVRFPEASLPGVDYVIPDYSYLKSNRAKIRALFITHGHEDHIGGIPFLVRTVPVPVIYAPRLAAALIRHKLEDNRIKDPIKIVEYDEDAIIRIANEFTVTFFRVTHSIPDAFGICIDTKQGRIIESGDFKIDLTPVGPKFEIDKIARLGEQGVDLLMADSTNAEIEGYTPSETNVRAGVDEIFDNAKSRIIVSTFSSNINRIQQVVEVALKHNRKVCIMGRSMKNVFGIARQYGYIKIPDDSVIEDTMLKNYRLSEICILCTGSQGEALAALSRIVNGDNKNCTIYPGDTVIFSSNPIPGNGALVDKLVNKLVKLGADVKQNSLAFSLHSSGHPSKQELRLLQTLVHPKYFMPIHGEYRMLVLHGQIAEQVGLDKENIFICDNGDVIELHHHKITRTGHVDAADVYIDGTDLDGLSQPLISDREILKNDGLVSVVVGINPRTYQITISPKIYTAGFEEGVATHVIRHSATHAQETLDAILPRRPSLNDIKNSIKGSVSKYIERKTDRKPMVIPVLLTEEKC